MIDLKKSALALHDALFGSQDRWKHRVGMIEAHMEKLHAQIVGAPVCSHLLKEDDCFVCHRNKQEDRTIELGQLPSCF